MCSLRRNLCKHASFVAHISFFCHRVIKGTQLSPAHTPKHSWRPKALAQTHIKIRCFVVRSYLRAATDNISLSHEQAVNQVAHSQLMPNAALPFSSTLDFSLFYWLQSSGSLSQLTAVLLEAANICKATVNITC